MATLVALTLPGGPGYERAIKRVWDAGDAIAPVDPRLPDGERRRVLDVLRPGAVIGPDGHRVAMPDGVPVDDGDALVIATSGTSGQPKAVIHTHDSVAASANATSAALAVDPAADRWVACLPLAHIGGLSVVLRSIVTGTPVEIHDRFDAATVLAAARDRGATLVSLVTRALAQVPADAFRTVLIGGAAPPADRPPNVVATYGMTETGSGVVYRDPGGPSRLLDGLDASIGPPDAPVVPGGEGEIHLRGPMLFRGYRFLDDPFVDGWFPTGDLGRIDPELGLTVAGRRGDVIVTGGEKVWPEPVERVIAARADVAEVALVGRPDPEWGHRVTAVVVTAAGHPDPTLESLRDTVKAELPAWAAPKELEIRTALPRTSLGKVRRNRL